MEEGVGGGRARNSAAVHSCDHAMYIGCVFCCGASVDADMSMRGSD